MEYVPPRHENLLTTKFHIAVNYLSVQYESIIHSDTKQPIELVDKHRVNKDMCLVNLEWMSNF